MGYEEMQAAAKIESVIRAVAGYGEKDGFGPVQEFVIRNLEDVKALLEDKR